MRFQPYLKAAAVGTAGPVMITGTERRIMPVNRQYVVVNGRPAAVNRRLAKQGTGQNTETVATGLLNQMRIPALMRPFFYKGTAERRRSQDAIPVAALIPGDTAIPVMSPVPETAGETILKRRGLADTMWS